LKSRIQTRSRKRRRTRTAKRASLFDPAGSAGAARRDQLPHHRRRLLRVVPEGTIRARRSCGVRIFST
jgi:hypothetical protein